ncbi:hypothetical protein H2199_004819 [Coniosporium tulheliwenetii]|uniref:Uncharacterized protein n=1 Tax=Coniosporium tulheliwenetii TaxID=3383036 RepID=A0ACC2Z465_9PEZI|nr:hypothetical protein H2199_004819 [Cladosporium sp. JES 115]
MVFGTSRKNNDAAPANGTSPARSQNTGDTLTPDDRGLSKAQIKRATKTRKTFALLSAFFLFISVIFLVLVEIGNTYNRPVLRDIYFIKLDLSHVVPSSVPNAPLLNTIARTLGLHDFYQVGLWGFCQGYDNEGITNCSPPKTLYWFNPVEIIMNSLLAGATIALPADVNDILDLIQMVSQTMFGLFLTGICLAFVVLFLAPCSVYSRLAAIPIAILTTLAALCITVGSALATAMFVIFRNTISGVQELRIGAYLGLEMFIFMWIASAFALLAMIIQLGECCCCTSRRDLKTGRKKAYTEK